MKAKKEDLTTIDDIGSIMAESIVNYFQNPKNIALINKLKSLGVNPQVKEASTNNKFLGYTFVLTGTLPTLSRDEASKMIEDAGGKTSSSVSRKTSFVLAGEEAGSKLTKAKELGIKIIDEETFIKMLNE